THFPGEAFATTSDTEVISRLYRRYGAKAFELLDGMFALAVIDLSSRTVSIARDLVGKKPLYVGHTARELCFSSHASLVGAHFGRGLNRSALAYYLEPRFVPPTDSLYADVKPVLPGQVMTFSCPGGSFVAACARLQFAGADPETPTLTGVHALTNG